MALPLEIWLVWVAVIYGAILALSITRIANKKLELHVEWVRKVLYASIIPILILSVLGGTGLAGRLFIPLLIGLMHYVLYTTLASKRKHQGVSVLMLAATVILNVLYMWQLPYPCTSCPIFQELLALGVFNAMFFTNLAFFQGAYSRHNGFYPATVLFVMVGGAFLRLFMDTYGIAW